MPDAYSNDLIKTFVLYKSLKGEHGMPNTQNNDVIKTLKNSTTQFPIETQSLALKLHQRLVDFGFKCEIKNRRFSTTGHFFLYSYNKGIHKRKNIEDIWIIRITPDDCGIRFNAKNASKYMNVIENLPLPLLNIIKNGDGCAHDPTPEKCKTWIENNGYRFSIKGEEYIKCNTKCCAACDFWIPLTNLSDDVSQAIEQWIDIELFHS